MICDIAKAAYCHIVIKDAFHCLGHQHLACNLINIICRYNNERLKYDMFT